MTKQELENKKELIRIRRELQNYKAIGTIEEFKDLKEKSIPKKVKDKWEKTPKDGIGMYSASDRWCPSCHKLLVNVSGKGLNFAIRNSATRYCACGQKLDWT